jgi:hypothetical protein
MVEAANVTQLALLRPYQFSLRQLMIGVTVFAVFCSLVVSSGLRPWWLTLAVVPFSAVMLCRGPRDACQMALWAGLFVAVFMLYCRWFFLSPDDSVTPRPVRDPYSRKQFAFAIAPPWWQTKAERWWAEQLLQSDPEHGNSRDLHFKVDGVPQEYLTTWRGRHLLSVPRGFHGLSSISINGPICLLVCTAALFLGVVMHLTSRLFALVLHRPSRGTAIVLLGIAALGSLGGAVNGASLSTTRWTIVFLVCFGPAALLLVTLTILAWRRDTRFRALLCGCLLATFPWSLGNLATSMVEVFELHDEIPTMPETMIGHSPRPIALAFDLWLPLTCAAVLLLVFGLVYWLRHHRGAISRLSPGSA